MRYILLFLVLLRHSFLLEFEFRINAIVNLINSSLACLLALLVLTGFFGQVTQVGGWSYYQMVALLGVTLIIESFIDSWLFPSIHSLSEYIRRGDLDFIIIRPVDAQFFISFHRFNLWDGTNFIVGYGVVLFAMYQQNALTMSHFLQFNFALLLGACIFYSLFMCSNLIAFWFTKISDIWVICYSLMDVGRFPVSAYPGSLRFLLSFLLPVFFVSNVPAQAALGILNMKTLLLAFLYAIGALVLTRLFWLKAISKYSSASS
ncbi:MAG: ABC-2 family transporter protein [Enterobacteriaceae bacterium]|jgi:ABC-2 type transport system permease protein|nr:ABC-2 family transporter protein [Enterobacteriaceae bacterium]